MPSCQTRSKSPFSVSKTTEKVFMSSSPYPASVGKIDSEKVDMSDISISHRSDRTMLTVSTAPEKTDVNVDFAVSAKPGKSVSNHSRIGSVAVAMSENIPEKIGFIVVSNHDASDSKDDFMKLMPASSFDVSIVGVRAPPDAESVPARASTAATAASADALPADLSASI